MSILFRNKPFETVRLTYTTFILGEEVTYFSEGRGTRYYYSLISSTNSTPAMEASTFESFLSFTMSNYNVRDIDVIPMEPGELVVIESTATAINTNGTKAYTNKAYGSYRHSGSQLKIVGGTSSFTYSVSTDFTGVDFNIFPSGTQSLTYQFVGEDSESLDWDVYIKYTKSFRALTNPKSDPSKPIYPK
jgi:hypothetical protein